MSITNRQDMLDMAIDMLKQAKVAQESLDRIREKTNTPDSKLINNSMWAKHCYNIVRGGIGIIEINTNDLKILSEKDIYQDPDGNEDEE